MLAACVGILVIPVTLQVISRYTPFIHLTSGPRRWRVSVCMDDHDRGDGRRQEAQHFESMCGRTCRGGAKLRCGSCTLWHPGDGAGVPVGWHRVHAVCLEPNLGAGRLAALAHSRRMAGGSLYMDRVCGEQIVDEARILFGTKR